MLTQGQTRWSIPPPSTMTNRWLAAALATSFLAGQSSLEEIIAQAGRTLGKKWPWLRPLAKGYVMVFHGPTRPRHREVVQFLLRNPGFQKACAKHFSELQCGSGWPHQCGCSR